MQMALVTQTVSEAKYTYWHSIIDIAAESGLSREEFCQRYKIALKTFRHYEGIFQRQKARGYVYNRKIEGNDPIDPSGESASPNDGTQGDSASETGKAENQKKGGAKVQAGKPDDRSRYVEIPMVGDDMDVVDAVDMKPLTESGSQSLTMSPTGDAEGGCSMNRESMVLDVGGCRIVIGDKVNESTLLSIIKAVNANA